MNIVLIEPKIPGNTGNIGRSCVGTQSTLHLVGRLGFSLSDKYLKRAGLDYWPRIDLKLHRSWDAFLSTINEKNGNLFFFEKDAERGFWDAEFSEDSFLIFGSETKGFSMEILESHRDRFYKIPMTGAIRSLNLSSAVAVALYEALRQTRSRSMLAHQQS